MREFHAAIRTAILALLLAIMVPACALAANDPCPRPVQGSVIANPPDLYSQNGVLSVTLDYFTAVDQWGRTLFCYATPDGQEAPTLHLNPGDTLQLTLANREQGGPPPAVETVTDKSDVCGAFHMTPQSVNLHFHGLNVSPKCHGDDVIHTLVNPGQSFAYTIRIPADEPPGLYWYHAHVLGLLSSAVEGGASGAIEIEGIANLQHEVSGLPQRFLIVRDQPLQNPPKYDHFQNTIPDRDVSLNFVPVAYPRYTPGVIQMQAGAQEFWRVANASANTIADLQLLYDGTAQPLEIVALDGVPTGSGDGTHQGRILTATHILIPPGGRAEFIITGPSASVKQAVLMTNRIDTGPKGAIDTRRPLAQIQLTTDQRKIPERILPIGSQVSGERFSPLDESMVATRRKIYFAETTGTGEHPPGSGSTYFLCVTGQPCVAYSPNNAPSITTHRGAVEDWTIENHTGELQEFHIHQIHFQLLAIDGKPVSPKERQWYDNYQLGFWAGTGKYPSITVRMDFRGPVVGEFVYESDLLEHTDHGMIANIRVLPHAESALKQSIEE